MLKLYRRLLVILILVSEVGCSKCPDDEQTRDECTHKTTIERLFEKTKREQVKSDNNFILPPLFWKKIKGIYGSDVKLNFFGNSGAAFMRDAFGVFDNNMFATAWITSSLIEAYKYGRAPMPSDEQIRLSLETISQYRDKNREQSNSIMTFWPQVYNDTVHTWQSAPINLLSLLNMAEYVPWRFVEGLLKLLGMREEAWFINLLINESSNFIKAFKIPADFDDTFVNLGLGALLTEFKDDFPESYRVWISQNSGVNDVWQALKKYAYRPFSDIDTVNTIDPRTYFYIRGFLEEARISGSDVVLVPTWVQNLAEDAKMDPKGVGMPFNINNVDVTVSANVVFGMTSAVISGLVDQTVLDDSDIQKIYANTTSMLVWQIERDFVGRRDLALTYYPSVFEFYWFISRTFFLLERAARGGDRLPEIFEAARTQFGEVLREHVTDIFFKEGQTEGDMMIFFDDFLGNGDVDSHGNGVIRGEDRIFTTAMAVNTLINTWTVLNQTSGILVWSNGTPPLVKSYVGKAAAWLNKYAVRGKYKPWNVFFSGSGKGNETMPFWYPINRFEFLNGTRIPLNASTIPSKVIMGMRGVVTEEEYQVMLNQTHFGHRTPLHFHGFNHGDGYFPFWSSNAYTYVTTMLALSQVRNLYEPDTGVNKIKPILPTDHRTVELSYP